MTALQTRPVHPLAAVPESDEAVVAEVLRGSVARFEDLMRRHNQRAFRAARAILRDDADAEDAAQQAWLRAYAYLAQFDGRAKFSTWLVRIVVNESLRRLKSRARSAAGADEPSGVEDSSHATPEDDAARAELRGVLERAIDGLPQISRAVIVLRDVEHMSTAEVGHALGMSEEAVRVRLLRARRALRAQIEAMHGDVFHFAGERCERIARSVLNALLTESNARVEGM